MADLVETPEWTERIYQLEKTDPVVGGPEGIDNLQAKQLANRTTFLKNELHKHSLITSESNADNCLSPGTYLISEGHGYVAGYDALVVVTDDEKNERTQISYDNTLVKIRASDSYKNKTWGPWKTVALENNVGKVVSEGTTGYVSYSINPSTAQDVAGTSLQGLKNGKYLLSIGMRKENPSDYRAVYIYPEVSESPNYLISEVIFDNQDTNWSPVSPSTCVIIIRNGKFRIKTNNAVSGIAKVRMNVGWQLVFLGEE